MKKVVLKLEFADEKIRQKAMKKVSGLSGLESITMDPKDGKLTLTGDIDPVAVVAKLRKLCRTDILTVGPAKEEPKKEEPKKGDDKKKEGAPGKDDSVKGYIHPYYYYQCTTTHHRRITRGVLRKTPMAVLSADSYSE